MSSGPGERADPAADVELARAEPGAPTTGLEPEVATSSRVGAGPAAPTSQPAEPAAPDLRARVRAEAPVLAPLVVAVFAASAYFVGPPAWNQNSRLALTRALVEQRTTIIDPYHATTGDKSFREGHFYSDKAPGTSLLAVPAYAVYYAVARAFGAELPEVRLVPLDPADAGREPDEREPGDRLAYNLGYRTALYVCRLGSVTLATVAATAALYLLALARLGARREALVLAATWALATPALIYGAAFYGHQLCADFLILGLAGVLLGQDRKGMAFGTGAALGLAVVCEYPAAVPVALVWLFAAWRRGVTFAAWAALGGLVPALALAGYHTAAFGHPLRTGYDFVYLAEFAEGMRVNYGIHAPDPRVLLEILFGAYRGLFYLSPVLLLAAWGFALELRGWPPAPTDRAGRTWPVRQVAALGLAITGFYLLLNAGYYMWDGGAAIGPRHCVPMLPFVALALAPAIRAVPRAVLVLALLSGLQVVVAAAAAPEAPEYGDPLWSYAWPRLLSGDTGYLGATNLGRMLGLPGPLSLAPLLLLFAWCWAQARPHLRG